VDVLYSSACVRVCVLCVCLCAYVCEFCVSFEFVCSIILCVFGASIMLCVFGVSFEFVCHVCVLSVNRQL
jgi:hypothetical protein